MGTPAQEATTRIMFRKLFNKGMSPDQESAKRLRTALDRILKGVSQYGMTPLAVAKIARDAIDEYDQRDA